MQTSTPSCAKSRKRLSFMRHLPDGPGGRSTAGGRSGVSRYRGRRAASDRFLTHAGDHDREPEPPAIMIAEKGADHVRGRAL